MQTALTQLVVPRVWQSHGDQYFPVFSFSNFFNKASETCKFRDEKRSNTVTNQQPL